MIESLPSHDSILVIWFKLLTFAGKQNNQGVFMFNDRIPYTDEMLATIFRRDVNLVRLALDTFKSFGMIDVIEDVVTIPNWNKYQSLDAYEKRKERDRLYQQERRRQQKLLVLQSSDASADSSSDVAFLEEDKEEDIDKELYIIIVDYLNEKASTNYKHTTKKTRESIHARLAEGFTVEDFKTVIDKKCAEWTGTEFEQYLRPSTLFGTKFEGYLNAKVVTKKSTPPAIDESKTDLDEIWK